MSQIQIVITLDYGIISDSTDDYKNLKVELTKDFLSSYKYKNEKGESLKNSIMESKHRPNGDHWTITGIEVEDLG